MGECKCFTSHPSLFLVVETFSVMHGFTGRILMMRSLNKTPNCT